jgi:hypothetical protein
VDDELDRATIRRSGLSDDFSQILKQFRRRSAAVGGAVAASWAVVTIAFLLGAFAWADLVVELPGPVRLICGIVALAVALVIVARISLQCRDACSNLEIARRLDSAAGSQGQILSGVDLAPAMIGGPMMMGLRHLAIRRAGDLINEIDPATAIPLKRLHKPVALIAAGLLITIGLAQLAPGLLSVQFLRFTDPFGDHPPYSKLSFDVDPGNAKVIYGGAVDIRATVHGGIADRLELVLNGSESLPMFPEGDGVWRATVADVTVPEKYILRTGRARTQQFNLDVITVPKLTDVKFRIQLPPYTNRPAYEGPLPQNGIAGLPGTVVEVHAKSNRPLSGGAITFAPPDGSAGKPQQIIMTPIAAGASEVAGQFQIQSSGKIILGVTDIAGQPSTETLTTSITLLTDQKPFVRIIEPKANSFATPDAAIGVEALAEDDYGISKVQIYRGLNDSRPLPTDISVPLPPPTQFPARMNLKLSDYGLSPGDVIQLFARAEDNDPAGPKGSESTVVTVHIISQADLDKLLMAREGMEALQSKYAEAQRRMEATDAQLEKLEKELANQDPKSPLADSIRKQIADAAKQMSDDADRLDKLADHELPLDIDKALTPDLKNLAEQLRQAGESARSASTQPSLGVASALDQIQQLRKALGQNAKDFNEQTNQPLEYMARIYPLLEDQARFLDLHDRQKDLADRLKSLQTQNGTDDPQLKARMRDLEDEQLQIRTDLRDLLEDVSEHAAALPDDKRLDDLRNTAKEFASAVRASPAAGQMQAVESSLEEFVGSPAASNAHDAEQTLDKFIAKCNSMGDQGGVCLRFQPKLAAGMGNSISQMLSSTGLGAGSGGYSAVQNSLRNVGLYGTLPTHSQESGGQAGGSADHGVASTANGSPSSAENPEGAATGGTQKASGQSDAPVPPEYKQRVGEYFRRVADELSN